MAAVSYDKLWKLLIDKKMNRTELGKAAGLSFNVIAKMGKCETISMESLIKICTTLKCDVSDVMEIIPTDGEVCPCPRFLRAMDRRKNLAKYGITEEEQAFIENMIRPMELNGGDDDE